MSAAAQRQGVVDVAPRTGIVAAVVGRVFSSQRDRACAANLLSLALRVEPGALPNGDFAAIVVTVNDVLLARDAQGRFPLYYRLEPTGRVAAASTSLRDLMGSRELDRSYFCSYLAASDASQQHIRATPFVRVERVFPGEVVVLSHDGRIQDRWTAVGARFPQLHADEQQQGRQRALRETLQQAVVKRMTSVTGCHLSGGLDSTSIALLAASALTAKGAPASRELVLVSATYASGELQGEQEYIDEAVAGIKRILPSARSVLVPADDLVDFDDFRQTAQAGDEPYAQAFRTPLLGGLASAAVAAGCRSLLTGCGGDAIVDASSLCLHRLVRAGRWRTALSEAGRWAERQDRSVRDVLTESVLRPAAPLLVEKVAHRRVPPTSIRSLGRFVRPPWLRRDFAERAGYEAAAKQEARFRLGGDPWESMLASVTFIAAPDPLGWWHAERDGLVWGHPFLDREVGELMRRHPITAAEDHGVSKGILRDALRDLLPPSIYARTRKVPFNDVYARGIRRHGAELVEACRSARHPLVHEMFDTDLLAQAVTEAGLGAGNAIATDRVNASLALLFWLEGLAATTSKGAHAATADGDIWETYPPEPATNA